tara:strand:- start:5456 stop:6418 length:963 start_codon:yes stop_codon:yes gene_type:complete
MNIDKILIVLGEPKSIFSEILFKYFKTKKFNKIKKDIILIGSEKLFKKQIKKLGYRIKLNSIKKIDQSKKNKINIINIRYNFKDVFSKINSQSNQYVKKCFDESLKILKTNKSIGLINGPVSKKHFLKKKYLGITEFISKKTNSKNEVMLIYNDKLSVSPITTHLPLKNVVKNISKKKIINNVSKINHFFINRLKRKPNFAILGLNPHCETIDKINEEKNIIIPAIKYLKKKQIKIKGPFSADTFFLKKNINNYDVVIGMYHDQVLTPIKTLFGFNAINITLGLPFIRISPDHGPNSEMIGKNSSDPSSIFCAMNFYNKL